MDVAIKPITKVNLKLVQGFILVAEQSSFRVAAALSGLSQSAVSAQIKRLEDQLGAPLFHRTTRRVSLTREGEELLTSARRAINEVEAGLRRIQQAVDIKRGRVLLACSPTIALKMLAPILAQFESHYPEIEVHVQEASAAAILEGVRERKVDFGVGPVLEADDLQFDAFMDDTLYALIPRRYGIGPGRSVSLVTLMNRSLLLLDRSTALRASLEDIASARGLQLSTRYQFTQAQTLVSMAEHGLGVAILPKVSLPERIPRSLRALPIDDPPLSRKLAIITLRGHTLSPAASRLAPLFHAQAAGPRAARAHAHDS
jgi:DNA-binding transcriptional LysR family regulator